MTTSVVVACSGVPVSTLNYWVQRDLVSPSVVPAGVQRAPRFWSARDLVVVRVIKALRDSGCSLQKVREARSQLEGRSEEDLASAVLVYDGSDIGIFDPDGARLALLKSGQGVFVEVLQVIAVPIKPWLDQANAKAKLTDISKYLERARLRQISERTRRTRTEIVVRKRG
jgi:DNA-binding transcriptional MerR regulator